MAKSSDRTVDATIEFSRPGYYHVAAAVAAQPAGNGQRWQADSLIRDNGTANLWILVDEHGGRLTDGYDSTAVPRGLIPLYGSYGPFIPRPRTVRTVQLGFGGRGSRGAGLDVQASSRAGPYPTGGGFLTASVLTHSAGAQVDGIFTYYNYSTSQRDPVPGAAVEALCWGKSDPMQIAYDIWEPVNATTNSWGGFHIGCSDGYEYVEGYAYLRDVNAYVAGKNGAAAGSGFAGYDSDQLDVRANNDYAARVFLDLSKYIPIVYTKFARTKQRTSAEVADNDEAWGIYYCPLDSYDGCSADDVILTNGTRVFSDPTDWDGLFVSLHEFAHGYQYYAVEPWASGSNACSGGSHGWTETENLGCAMVEGFADFIAMLGTGATVDTTPYGGDYGLENNLDGGGQPTNPPSNGDGARVEAAVAAFLYDLVDGDSEPDGTDNHPGSPETVDSLSTSASWLLDVMEYCRLNGQPLELSGVDQLVYCTEGSTSAYSEATNYSSSWRSYSSVSYEQSLSSYSQSLIRKLWKYDFYGQ